MRDSLQREISVKGMRVCGRRWEGEKKGTKAIVITQPFDNLGRQRDETQTSDREGSVWDEEE